MKSFLFIMNKAPFHDVSIAEQLDMVLTTAAFDQKVAVLFMDDGVLQLLSNQNPGKHRDITAVYDAFSIYEIKDVYVELESLQQLALKPGDLTRTVKEVYRKDIAGLMRKYNVVVGG